MTTAGLLRALLARPWGQAAEMLAALGVDPADLAELAEAGVTLAARAAVASRPLRRDPRDLLSSAWRRPADDPPDGPDDVADRTDDVADGTDDVAEVADDVADLAQA